MVHYKNRTFCSDYKQCKTGKDCYKALTPEVIRDAAVWWGKSGAPIIVAQLHKICMEKASKKIT